jgi:hypothetical protein
VTVRMATGLDTTSSQPRQRRPRRSELPTERTPADLFMRRLLRLPLDAPPGSAKGARKAFQTSLIVATFRCLLMYVAFPFVLPALGLAKGVGPVVGLVINLVAMVCIVMSMRRFFGADHPKRWPYTALGGSVLVFLVVLAVQDVVSIAT